MSVDYVDVTPAIGVAIAPPQEEYVYNTADALEQNPEVLRAELLFYNNPQTSAYSPQVYYALQNVQDQCQADYVKFCTPQALVDPQIPVMEKLFASSIPFFLARKLGEVPQGKVGSGRKLLEYLRSYYVPGEKKSEKSFPKLTKDNLEKLQQQEQKSDSTTAVRSHVMRSGVSKVKLAEAMRGSSSRRLRGEKFAPLRDDSTLILIAPAQVSESSLGMAEPAVQELPLVDAGFSPGFEGRGIQYGHGSADRPPRDPRGPPNDAPGGPPPPPPPPRDGPPGKYPPKFPPRDDASDSGSDSDSDDESDGWDGPNDHGPHHHHGHHHPPDQIGFEDTYFPGALGFGASGDSCVYENVQNLSPTCMQAISDLYVLRSEYWETYSSSQQSHGHHSVIFPVLFVILIVSLVKKVMLAPRRKQVHAFLSAINGNPELKAKLESELNMAVPAPREPCCGGQRGSFLARLCRALVLIVAAMFVGFFISVTSLEMTASIVDNIEQTSQEPASPFTVIMILVSIIAVEVVALVGLLKGLRYCCHRVRGTEDDAANGNVNRGNFGSELRRVALLPVSFYNDYLVPNVGTWFQGRSGSGSSDGYSPLHNGEEREMIAVGRSTHGAAGPQYAVYTGLPVNPQSYVVPVAVTARPVNAVSLV